MTEKTETKYICAAGVSHPRGRNERGDAYTGSERSLVWLVEQGHVVEEGSVEHAAIVADLAAAASEEE